MNFVNSVGYNGIREIFFQMLKLWDLDDTFEKWFDEMKYVIETEVFFCNPYYLRVYRDISLQFMSSF